MERYPSDYEGVEAPDRLISDPLTGFALNLPLGKQGLPGWQDREPDVLEYLIAKRTELGIVVPDDMWEGTP